jgi:hypothetical protein
VLGVLVKGMRLQREFVAGNEIPCTMVYVAHKCKPSMVLCGIVPLSCVRRKVKSETALTYSAYVS